MTEAEKHAEGRDDQPDSSSDDASQTAPESSREKPSEDTEGSTSGGPPNAGASDSSGGRGGSGRLVAALALLLALASLVLAGYPFWAKWVDPDSAEAAGPSSEDMDRLAGRIDAIRQDSRSQVEALRDDLDELSSEFDSQGPGPDVEALSGRVDQLATRIERLQGERNTDLSGMRSRLEELESELGRRLEQFDLKLDQYDLRLANVGSDLDQADQDLGTRLLLMEVDSLFAMAQNSLIISDNTEVALQAWERAMARIQTLDASRFQTLKETASRELSRLQGYRPPEVGSKVEQLFAIAGEVGEWPVKTVQPGQSPATDPGSEAGWRSRLGQVVGSLVRVESVDRTFLGPDEIDRAREQVRSLLQTAALAMVRSRPELARGVLDEALDAVPRTFDVDAANVSEALSRLSEITVDSARDAPPELTESRAEIASLLGEMR